MTMRTARLAAQGVDAALRCRDVSAGAFAGYVRGRESEVAALVNNLRNMLRFVRDRDALLGASTDDALLAQALMPLPVSGRGSLLD